MCKLACKLLRLKRRLQQTRLESEALKKRMAEDKPLTTVRRALPAWDVRERIQSAVRDNPVIVIEGDTGCGKSTQVPQFLLEDWAARGEGGAVNILMTQPRRLSAIGVSERIATEMDCCILRRNHARLGSTRHHVSWRIGAVVQCPQLTLSLHYD
eukprot:567191-Amphidinium_carterae.1